MRKFSSAEKVKKKKFNSELSASDGMIQKKSSSGMFRSLSKGKVQKRKMSVQVERTVTPSMESSDEDKQLNRTISDSAMIANHMTSPREALSPKRKTSLDVNLIKKMKKVTPDEVILHNPLALMTMMEIAPKDDDFVGIALATYFIPNPQVVRLTSFCISSEVDSTLDSALILRGSGIYTKILSTVINISGRDYLKNVLSPIVNTIITDDKPMEADPTRTMQDENIEKNIKNLMDISTKIITELHKSISDLPGIIAIVARELYNKIKESFAGMEAQSVGGLLVLRFLVPALTMPDSFGIVKECSRDLRRKLILIGKVLQAVYNGVVEQKEEWMQPFKGFVDERTNTVEELADLVLRRSGSLDSKAFSKGLKELQGSKADMKSAKSTLNNFFYNNMEQIQELLAKMVTVDESSDDGFTMDSAAIPGWPSMANALSVENTIGCSSPNTEPTFALEELMGYLQSQAGKSGSLTHAANEDFNKLAALLMANNYTEEEYNICCLRVTDERNIVTLIEIPREEFSQNRVASDIKKAYSSISVVMYYKDGQKKTLTKSSFHDFEGSAVVNHKRATYKVSLTRKKSALDGYLQKI